MTRGKFLLGSVAATLALTVTPAMAQRSAGGGGSSGSAVERGGGSSGGDSGGGGSRGSSGDSGSSSSSGSGSGSSSSSSGSNGGSYSAPSSPTAREYVTAPTRPSEREQRQRGDGGSREGSREGSTGRARTAWFGRRQFELDPFRRRRHVCLCAIIRRVEPVEPGSAGLQPSPRRAPGNRHGGGASDAAA